MMQRVIKTLIYGTLFIFTLQSHAFEFEGKFPTKDYPYTIYDSHIKVCVDCWSVVAWLDNDRVIFTRLKAGEKNLQMKEYKNFVYYGETVIWDTKQNSVTPYHDGMLWCSSKGSSDVSYHVGGVKSQETAYSFFGAEGNELVERVWQRGEPVVSHYDRHTCTLYDGLPMKPDTPNWTYPLREQDGVIDVGRKKNPKDERTSPPVSVIRPDGPKIILPLGVNDVKGVWWDEWAQVYILKMFVYNRILVPSSAKNPDRLIFLHPDGTVQKYELPFDYWWSKTTDRAVITKKGVVVVNESTNQVNPMFPRADTSGAYLVRDTKVVRLNDWLVGNERAGFDNIHRGIAVSPDGCKIAYKHTNGPRQSASSTIQMINLCEGDE